jgi:hypothetical protein
MRSSINGLRWIVTLCSALAAVGCAHSQHARPKAPLRAFECPASEAARAQTFGHALKLARDVDYLGVISHGGGHDQMTVAERGTKCSGATDLEACDAELTRQKQAWVQAHSTCDDCAGATLVVTTRNDEITLWTQPEQQLTLLGAIDSPADAWLLMMLRTGYPPYSCGDASGSAYRVVPEGIELLRQEWVSVCRPVERVEIVELFERDGDVIPVRRSVVEHEVDGCIVP